MFLSYYLTDTSVENGCMKEIPGSHRRRIPLHDKLVAAHEQGARYIEEDHPVMFSDHPDQVDVCVKAGSLVLADARILHSAYRNQTDERRTVLTMWYYPDYVALPERTQATVASVEVHNNLSEPVDKEIQALLAPLKIAYDGAAAPIETQWVPGEALK